MFGDECERISFWVTGNDILKTIGVDVIKLLKQAGVTGELLSDSFEEVLPCYNAWISYI